jgi:tripartite tricarboxylate transporter family receptor
MKLLRSHFLRLAAATAAFPISPSRLAWATEFPARPVRIVVGFAAGGGTDIIARLIGQWLSERLGKPFVIENRPGAGSNIATEAVVRARPDGYSLLLIGAPNSISATLYKFRFHARHHADRLDRARALRNGVESIGEGQHDSGIRGARQSQSWQAQYGIGRHR